MPAYAATDMVEVYFLPMQEAADAARSQLSDDGKVAAIPSRQMLIIDDDQAHIAKAKALLKRLDHPAGQYTAYLNFEDVRSASRSTAAVSGQVLGGRLSGGWVQLKAGYQQSGSQHRQSFQLRISSNKPGSMETGTLRSFSRESRLWLSGYGLIQAN
ncbi:MAG: type II and III secretion system family protein, partial [Mariprofundaceae bacterium]